MKFVCNFAVGDLVCSKYDMHFHKKKQNVGVVTSIKGRDIHVSWTKNGEHETWDARVFNSHYVKVS